VQEKGGLQTNKRALSCASRMRRCKPSACKVLQTHSRYMRRAETVGVQLGAICAVPRQCGALFLHISMYSAFGTERGPFLAVAGGHERKHVDRGISRLRQHRKRSAEAMA
jgi:hypothetical protein